MPEPTLLSLADRQYRTFEFDPSRNVPRKPPRMDQPFLFPQPVRIDQHLPEGAVRMAQPRAIILHRLPLRQPIKHVRSGFHASVKLGTVPPEDLVPAAA